MPIDKESTNSTTWEGLDLRDLALDIASKCYPLQQVVFRLKEVRKCKRPAYAVYVREAHHKRGRWIATIVPFQTLPN